MIGHDADYQGPPPNLDDYSEANDYSPHSTYGVPSDGRFYLCVCVIVTL